MTNQGKKKIGYYVKRFCFLLILFLLFTIGLIFIFNEPIKQYLVRSMTQEVIQQAPKDKNEKKAKPSFDFSDVKEVTLQDVAKERANLKKNIQSMDYLGTIDIPSVHINLPILEGVSNSVLSSGAGTMKPNQKMGTENYALASHNMNDQTTLFSPLVNLQKGAKIYLKNSKHTYIYKAESIRYISPKDTQVIANHGKKEITLITCNTSGDQRLCVQGPLIATE